MRKVIFALTAAFALVAFLSACGMGLEPAKTDTTSVSLSLTVMSPLGSGGSTDAGRAIIPDGGYLYVRMLGGPTANTPRYLGPYQVRTKSSTISITDIPAGRYDGMFLLYADRVVHNEEVTIEGDATTLGEIFSLPDTDFRAFVKGDDEYEVDVLLAGRASIGMVESPRVVEGVENSFPVTMIPVTPYWIPIAFGMFGNPMYLSELLYTFDGTEYESFKGFVGIPALQMIISSINPGYTGDVTLTFSNESETDIMTVNSLSVYDAEGVRTAAAPGPYPVTMTAGQKNALTVPVPDSVFDEIFFYLDVSGGTPAITITLDEGGTAEPEIPETETITGSLNLRYYIGPSSNMPYFDSVDRVLFATTSEVPVTQLLNWSPESGAPPEGIVGWGGLTANATNGYHDFTGGTIYSEYASSDLYLIVVGTKYEQPVMYASTDNYQVSEMSGLTPAMTPLVQYMVVYDGEFGLDRYDGNIAKLELDYADTSFVVRDTLYSTVGIIEHEELEQVYAAIFILTPVEFNYIQLSLGEDFNNLEFYAGRDIDTEDINANDAFIYVNIPMTQ